MSIKILKIIIQENIDISQIYINEKIWLLFLDKTYAPIFDQLFLVIDSQKLIESCIEHNFNKKILDQLILLQLNNNQINIRQHFHGSQTLIHFVIDHGLKQSLSKLFNDYNIDDCYEKLLDYAAKKGDENLFKHLLCIGANVNQVNEKNQRLLYIAFKYKQLKIISIILKNKNLKVTYDKKLLFSAVRKGEFQLVKKLLVDNNINDQDEKGNTLLHIAAKYGHHKIAKFLIDQNIDISMLNKQGLNALDIAIKFNHIHAKKVNKKTNTSSIIPGMVFHLLIRGAKLTPLSNNNKIVDLNDFIAEIKYRLNIKITSMLDEQANIHFENEQIKLQFTNAFKNSELAMLIQEILSNISCYGLHNFETHATKLIENYFQQNLCQSNTFIEVNKKALALEIKLKNQDLQSSIDNLYQVCDKYYNYLRVSTIIDKVDDKRDKIIELKHILRNDNLSNIEKYNQFKTNFTNFRQELTQLRDRQSDNFIEDILCIIENKVKRVAAKIGFFESQGQKVCREIDQLLAATPALAA